MLLSKTHKFIFIHVAKNGGQSVSNALFPHCIGGLRRTLSPIFPYRYQLKVNSGLRRYFGITLAPQVFHDHASAMQVSEEMGAEEFASYFSFAFVRNPWDWVVSHYNYSLQNPRHHSHDLVKGCNDFNEFISKQYLSGRRVITQKSFIAGSDGEILVDYVGRQEKLAGGMQEVGKRLGLDLSLPHFNESVKRKPYWEYYDAESIEVVGNVYAEDVEAFGYTFEG